MVLMFPYADVDLDKVRALSHPLRVRILAVLGDRVLTAAHLAEELGTDARTISAHARQLEQLGFIKSSRERARGREGVSYRLVTGPHLTDEVWDRTPTTAKRDTVSGALAQLHNAAAAALAEGGFDRGDVHFTRTGLDLDEEGWRAISTEMLEWLSRVDQIRDQAAARIEAGASKVTHATANLMLFETASANVTHDEPGELDEELFVEGEGLERAFQLSEQLEELLVRPNPPWSRVVALVDQLRVIARVVMAQQDAELPPVEDR